MKNNSNKSGHMDLLRLFASTPTQTQKVVFGDKAITYNRCSHEKQNSVEWQEKITAAFVKQNGWTLVKTFGEKESAKTDDRKEFQEMLCFCRANNISHIVFHSYDRFSRAGNLNLPDELRAQGIKVHAATQFVDDDTPGGQMIQKMLLIIAKMDNDQRRIKIIEGQRNKLRKGEWVVAPPLGYEKRYIPGEEKVPHAKKQCFINATGGLIQQAFNWKDQEKLSNVAIILRLKSMGLTLTNPELTRIFRNPFYCGYITNALLDAGEIILGKHEPLVSVEVFLRVNGIINETKHGWKHGENDFKMPLKVTIKCGKCNLPITGYLMKNHTYYKCRTTGCGGLHMRNDKLHRLFENDLSKIAVRDHLRPIIKEQLEKTYWMLHANEAAREKPMKDELARLKSEVESMELNLATGILPLDLFYKHSSAHKEKILAIEGELETLKRDTSNFQVYLSNSLQFAENLVKMWHSLDHEGKIRLQKLVYPEGLVYIKENDVVRTNALNPIFFVISSISQIFSSETTEDEEQKSEKLQKLYFLFRSSNLFWDNLEKTALEATDLERQLNSKAQQVISMTGSTDSDSYYYSSDSTKELGFDFKLIYAQLPYSNSYTGSTCQSHIWG